MQSSYWSGLVGRRVSRRRAITGGSAAAVAAAILAACGGSGSKSSGGDAKSDKSGLIVQPTDTTKQAKKGGVLKHYVGTEPAHLDVAIDQASYTAKNYVYGQLTSDMPGHLKRPDYADVTHELAESWEWSPDRLTLTMKIRQGVNWHNRAPVNGRVVDPDDYNFSWQRYAAKATDRASLVNAVNPGAPVLSYNAIDKNTIVLKLKEPVIWLLNAFGHSSPGRFIIVPKETDTTFDSRKDMIGTGPYVFENWTPSVSFTLSRNKDYFDPNIGFADRVEMPIVLEYAQALAQFKAGNIYSYSVGNFFVKSEDIVPLKKDAPDLLVYQNQPSAVTVRGLQFGILPAGSKIPFGDERVRQAISMSWDRDAWIDTFYNVSKFATQGLPVQSYWHSAVHAGVGSFWLDPKGKDFGPNAKYYKQDVAEAKKLLAAAGYQNGFDVLSSYIPGTQLGADFQRQVSVLDDFARNAGIRPKVHEIDYNTEYIPIYRDGNGKFEGWSYRTGNTSAAEVTQYLTWRFHSTKGGPGFFGFDVNGKGDGSGDPAVDDMITKAAGEIDTEKRKALVFDIQRYLAQKQYGVIDPGVADNFLMTWPVIKNFQVEQLGRLPPSVHWWLDDTQAPLKKS